MPAETPTFVVVFGDFVWMGTKRTLFQKQIAATKMRAFFTFGTQIVFANFSRKCRFNKKDRFSSRPPKKHYFSVLLKFSFSMFSSFLFRFIQHNKDKNKRCICFRNPLFFDNSTTCTKRFSHPYTHLCFFRCPQNTLKLVKNKQHKISDRFLTQPWPDF